MSWRSVPGSQRLVIHADSGRRGRTTRVLAGTSDWRRDIVDRAGALAIAMFGTERLSPAPLALWPDAGLDRLASDLASELPGLRLIGLALPRQSGRRRMSALGRMAGNPVVLKLGGDDLLLSREAHALEQLAANPLPGIATPAPLAAGTFDVGGQAVTYLVTTAIALRGQRAAIDEPLRTFEADLAARLTPPRPEADHGDGDGDEASELVVVHGDLTPWNLRRTNRGLALFDWESVGWGPAGSDLAAYRTACDEVRRPWARSPRASAIGAQR